MRVKFWERKKMENGDAKMDGDRAEVEVEDEIQSRFYRMTLVLFGLSALEFYIHAA